MLNQDAVEIIENGSHDTDLINEALKSKNYRRKF